MNATWTGTRRNAVTIRKSVSRNGKRIHEKAYAASAPIPSGRSVEGTAMNTVFMNAWSMPWASSTWR